MIGHSHATLTDTLARASCLAAFFAFSPGTNAGSDSTDRLHAVFVGDTTAIPVNVNENSLIDLINHERKRRGLHALSADSRLMLAAMEHSEDMANGGFLVHRGSDGLEPDERVASQGYRWRFTAENIGCGYRTPEALLQGWLSSPGHRANLLSREAKDIGVALAERRDDKCRYYWTAVFASRR